MLQQIFGSRNADVQARISSQLSQDSKQDSDACDDYETFSTPPSTPTVMSLPSSASSSSSSSLPSPLDSSDHEASKPTLSGPTLSRRGSRPTSLHIDRDKWTPNVLLEDGSPNIVKDTNGAPDDQSAVRVNNRDRQSLSRSTSPAMSLSPATPQPQSRTRLQNGNGIAHSSSPAVPVSALATVQSVLSGLHSSNLNAERSYSDLLSSTSTSRSGSGSTTSRNSGSAASAPASSGSGSRTATQRQYNNSQPGSGNHLSNIIPDTTHTVHTTHSHHPDSQSSYQPPLKSPCFVHSNLDKGASFADWLNTKQGMTPPLGDVGVAHSLEGAKPVFSQPGSSQSLQQQLRQRVQPHAHHQLPQNEIGLSYQSHSPGSSLSSEFDDDDDGAGSLTRQLAETAVGVREMSKQLGRARVHSNIQNVLIITKARDNRLIKLTREIALYLMQKPRNGGRGLVVYVDNQLRYSKRFDAAGIERDHPEFFVPFPRRRSSSSNSLASMVSYGSSADVQPREEGQLRYWTSDMCNRSPHLFDFVVTLGGDGTVLFTSWLFQRIVPPVLPFALGSLGFLTNFDFADYQAVMDSALDNGIRVNLRMRFTCTVYRAVAPEPGKGRRAVKKADTGEILMRNLEKGGWEALEGGWSGLDGKGRCGKDKEIMCFTTRPVECFEVLNDLVVDRGPSPYVSLLELFGDEHHMTTVQADGLTVSTPTGSTAYSLSAGGSLVHPEIPALLITPICPHTLSFRPMLLPDSMELRICVPFNSRSTAWASFDGRGRVELKQGDHIKVTASKYPFPTVCADKQSTDWFHAISRTLKWNERERQKSFVVVEEGPAKPKHHKHKESTDGVAHAKPEPPKTTADAKKDDTEEEDECSSSDDEEDEEEKFDIDDSSAPEASAAPSSTDLVAMEKAKEEEENARARDAALALSLGNPAFRAVSNTYSRDGIETPDRFAGAHPHPPRVSPRHVSFDFGDDPQDVLRHNLSLHHHGVGGPVGRNGPSSLLGRPSSASPSAGAGEALAGSALSSTESLKAHDGQKGDRDHIHAPQLLSGGRSRIPRDRDIEAESMNLKTPTAADSHHGGTNVGTSGAAPGANAGAKKSHGRTSSIDRFVRRAFAVWGQDESDSNASDSDV